MAAQEFLLRFPAKRIANLLAYLLWEKLFQLSRGRIPIPVIAVDLVFRVFRPCIVAEVIVAKQQPIPGDVQPELDDRIPERGEVVRGFLHGPR